MSAWENYHLEWSADPLSVTSPTWQDITSYALAAFGPPITITGGVPTMGSAAQPTVMSVSLDNHDHRFTFGNTTSPLSPNWKPGRRIRCYETIAGKRFDLFTGYIQPPETDDFAEQGIDQYVTLTAIDRLGRVATGRNFISTLAEHVIYNGGAALRAYYPLGNTTSPYRPVVGGGTYAAFTESVQTFLAGDQTQNGYHPASGAIGNDDLAVPSFAPQYQPGTPYTVIAETLLFANYGSGIATTGQHVTIACWVLPATNSVDAQWQAFQIFFGAGAASGFIRVRRTSNDETPFGEWKALFSDTGTGAWTATAYGAPTLSVPTLLACRINLAANTMSLFVDTQQFDAVVTGTMPSSVTLLNMQLADSYAGLLGHVQVYDSTSTSDYSLAAQQAQYAMGIGGLQYQYTGQRITTLMQYAGVLAGDLGYIDPGTAIMQKATLAGKNPLTAMREAEITEQGRLHSNGQGLPVFDARTRRYNS